MPHSIDFRQLASNFSFLTAGELISKLLTFGAFTLLARVFGPEGFGYLEFVLAVMVFFTLLIDFGTSPYGAREIAKNKNRAVELISDVVLLRIFFAVAGYLLLVIFISSLPAGQLPVRKLLLLYGLTLFAAPGFLQWVFQGLEKMKLVALGSVVRQSIFAVTVFALIRRPDQMRIMPWIECAAVAGLVIYNVCMVRSQTGPLKLQMNAASMKSTFVQALPIGLSELTWASTWYFPTVLLGLMIGGKSVGWFSAALRPVMTLHTFVWLYFYNLLPSMSRYTEQPHEDLQQLVGASLKVTSWSAVFLGVAGVILANPLILLVFGPQYAESLTTFKLLIWMVPIALLSGHYRYILIAFNHQKFEFLSSACTAVVSVVLSLFLIPNWGANGAAIALLIAALLNWTLAYWFVREKIGRIPLTIHMIKPFIAGGAMVAGFLLLSSVNVWLAAVVGSFLFGCTLILLQPEARKVVM